MSLSAPFIRRRIGTTLLTVALALSGGIAFLLLPVAPLPQVEFPTIQVSAGLPGASPETMASAVATPLEGEERDRVWTMLKQTYPFFADHDRSTSRAIPVVALARA